MNRFGAILTITLLAVIQGVRQCPAQELWTGPKIIYSQAANTDISLPENQDRITDNVWLTRDVSRGLFNIKTEMSFVNFVSPADTEWSLGTTADYDTLPYEDWQSAIGSDPPGSVGEDMVMHLITDDLYLDIKFLTWGVRPSAGGFFSYERSTPIPEPSADFDNNGIVDGLDFLKWQIGILPNPFSQSDLALWESQYGDPLPVSAVSAVPEPTTSTLALAALCLAMSRRQAF